MSSCSRSAVLCTLVFAFWSASGRAQSPDPLPRYLESHDPATPDLDLQALRTGGFRLFANSDLAATGMRGVGSLGTHVSNVGPCDPQFIFGSRCYRGIGAGSSLRFFEIPIIAGAPPSDFAKVRAAFPNARFARGDGWTVAENGNLFGRPYQNGPADAQLGVYFSGVVSTGDGACTDYSSLANGPLNPGWQLLAGSDCPATWGPRGFEGPRRVGSPSRTAAETWRMVFEGELPAFFDSGFFQFNEWQLPDSLFAVDRFLGQFSTYGAISDYNADTRTLYGRVTPGGMGDPQVNGWPMGLRWEFAAWTTSVPWVASAMFWRARVINRSADVYGIGIDFDSLYLGFMPGTGTGGGDRYSNYYLPQYSAGLYHQSGNTPDNCGPERRPAGVSSCAAFVGSGLVRGADFIVVLKSPIGDLRNKLFTRTPNGAPCVVGEDPFCDPSHPLRGDTITFNQGHMCGFGGCWANTHNVRDKRAFGLLSSQEDVTIDGDAGFTRPGTTQAWRTFRSYDYPTITGIYNRFVPGMMPWPEEGQIAPNPASIWDWNDDGIPDTLFFDSCDRTGCVGTSQDTMPGGQINAYGNIGGILAAGPVRLPAGDTTEFLAVFISERDSVRVWEQLHGVIDYYLSFYLEAEAPPPTRILATTTTAHVDSAGNTAQPVIQLFLSDDGKGWVDPYLLRYAAQLEAAQSATPLGQLRDLNTDFELLDSRGTVVARGLVEALRHRASDNVAQLEVYKSCDGGSSFTADADCVGDRATTLGGEERGLGWQAYALLRPHPDGSIPSVFTDSAVSGGRRYQYAIVGTSRGARFLVNTPAGPDSVTFAPELRNALSLSPGHVGATEVSVPISRAAGTRLARALFEPRRAQSTVPFDLVFTDTVGAGRYEAIFGNTIEVVETHQGAPDGELLRSEVVVSRVVTADVGGMPTPVVIQADSFVRMGHEPVALAGVSTDRVTDSVVTRTLDGLGFVLARGETVLFASTALTGSATTPARFYDQSLFSGFLVSANQTLAAQFRSEQVRVSSRQATPRLVPTGQRDQVDVEERLVHWQPELSAALRGGRYEVTWADEPFGLPEGIVLDFDDPDATRRAFAAALAGRQVGTTGATDAETAGLIGVPQSDLVAVRVPFAVRNVTYDRPVEVAMTARVASAYRLGTGPDTLSVIVPADQWVPGDVVSFIETVTEDSVTETGVVLDPVGQPVPATHRRVTMRAAVLGCDADAGRGRCNPVARGTPGSTAYAPVLRAGDRSEFEYYVGFSASERIAFEVTPPVPGSAVTSLSAADLERIRVVPNPFLVASPYVGAVDPVTGRARSRIAFTNVPPSGTIRIYTVAGQFVQQITWATSDLEGTGDLYYDLTSRGGNAIASGLYLWVLTTNVGGTAQATRGKFVVIQSRS